jgi:hypothetical protein
VPASPQRSPQQVAAALAEALNTHDLEAFVGLFSDTYDSRQPAHPDRAFVGSAQVRENWSQVFEGVPDFHAELVASAVAGETVWSEWRWTGTQRHGGPMAMAGVMIFGVQDGAIAWARLYVEPIEQGGAGIASAVRDIAGRG